MKAIRRSIKGDKGEKGHHHHISISQKDAVAIVPPKKVIRALYDYEAKPDRPQELSFSRGDFFHVIGRENDTDWYEACNPSMPNARGLVPVQFFQVLGRTERDSAGSTTSAASKQIPDHDSGYSDRSGTNGSTSNIADTMPKPGRLSKSMGRGGAMVYGIVLYDFSAERPDELEAKAGEAIIVIAQSTAEWFVAKPIGRLGGPGLIPVSFIEIRDMTTGQSVTDAHSAVQRAGVPTVEDWKKMAADYKNSSITLGKFETQSQQQMQQGMERMSLQNGQGYQNGHTSAPPQSHDPSGSRAGTSAGPAGNSAPTNGWDRTSTSSVSQPPAPVSAKIPQFCFANDKYWYIIEAVMEDGRHWELSRYYQDFYDFQIRLLTQFPEEAGNSGKPRTLPFMPGPVTYVTDAISNGRRQNLDEYIRKLLTMPPYIARCSLVRQLFAPREGDFEIDPNSPRPDNNDHRQNQTNNSHGGNGVGGGGYDPHDRDSADYDPDTASRQSSRNDLSTGAGLSAPPNRHHQHQQSHGSTPPPGQYNGSHGLGMPRQSSNLTQTSGGSGSTTNVANGGGGMGGSGAAMKIKVYFQDDLIAIRVAADIRFEALRERLRERLHISLEQSADMMIQYKDEPSNSYVELRSSGDLDVARDRNQKLTLYVNVP